MTKNKNLELTCIDKEKHPRLEPHSLPANPEKYYHAKHWIADESTSEWELV